MSKRMTAVIAAATAALAALAVVALPAIGDSGSKATGKDDPNLSALAACLSAHGLSGAPTTGPELKTWLAAKTNTDPDLVGTAMDACQSRVPDGGPGPEVQAMITCVRSHGIDAPAAPDDFKRWLGDQEQAGPSKAVQDTLIACKAAPPDQTKPAAGAKSDCAPAGATRSSSSPAERKRRSAGTAG
jgi:hypothetical protein